MCTSVYFNFPSASAINSTHVYFRKNISNVNLLSFNMMYLYWSKGQTTLYKTLHRKLKIEQHEPTKTWGQLRYSGRAISSCSTGGTRRVTLVTNPLISHECSLFVDRCLSVFAVFFWTLYCLSFNLLLWFFKTSKWSHSWDNHGICNSSYSWSIFKGSPKTRSVWRYQRGNQNPYIEEEQTKHWPKEKEQKDKQESCFSCTISDWNPPIVLSG